ncbi:hypothetical protein BH11GEM2_BH11GEM2_21790 [soil metagenome]
MPRVRRKPTKNQHHAATAAQHAIPLDDGTVTTPAALAMIRALSPLGLRAVEEALLAEVTALAGSRYARNDDRPAVVRWGAQPESIFLADQQLPVLVPRVRDRAARCEIPLATYAALQTPRAQDVGLFRKVLGGLSCREFAAFLRELGARGCPLDDQRLVVLDGAKGLRAAVRDVCGDVPVQRCQWHKRENVVSYLAKQPQDALFPRGGDAQRDHELVAGERLPVEHQHQPLDIVEPPILESLHLPRTRADEAA